MARPRCAPRAAWAVVIFLSTAMAAEADSPTGDAITSGQSDFAALCSPCHGENATGDGPAAAGLAHKPADLTHITRNHGGKFPDSLIFETIEGLNMPSSHGTREMPVWGDVFVGEAVGNSVSLAEAKKAGDEARKRIEALVLYLKSIQAKD